MNTSEINKEIVRIVNKSNRFMQGELNLLIQRIISDELKSIEFPTIKKEELKN